MHWLSNPKVKLALFINGLYLLTLFFPTSSPSNPRLRPFAHTSRLSAEREAPRGMPEYVPLPPPSAPGRATAYESGGLLHVSLSKDLTLVQRPGRTLLLSPSFSARLFPQEDPESVRLSFIIYSNKETCPDDCSLTINADGATVWTSYSHDGSPGWQRERVPHSATLLGDQQVLETLGAESLNTTMTYEAFIAMISAKRVIVRLGTDRVELTSEQIDSLRDMYRCLPTPPPDEANSY